MRAELQSHYYRPMFRGGILIAIACAVLALAAVLAMSRVPHQGLLDTTDITNGN